ncbi:hypothetical protein COR50_20075 [Chitinophaga caeni]|uniref:DNA-binding response regulator n=1 Tax=Chitinophaga caeni TaxID=2029983 RepID=A0A291QZC6_9BACT|nr:response regulator transcription factor [Chitinophaga caeni]ATL49285.1 hypothetical protein COR50_20075 [Chitinophaga caeni]
MKQILIVDEQPITRYGLTKLIQDQFPGIMILEASTDIEFHNILKRNTIDLLIMDLSFPGGDIFNSIELIRDKVKILVFSNYDESVYGLKCLKMGVSGFIHKSASINLVRSAVKSILAGKKFISETLSEQLVHLSLHDWQLNPFDNLSNRELEVATMMEQGISLPEISRQLNLGYSTCNTYKRRLYEKLEIRNSHSLTRLMRVYGLAK